MNLKYVFLFKGKKKEINDMKIKDALKQIAKTTGAE